MSREARSDTPFVDFAAGSTILHQGETAGALYIVEAGKVAIERPEAPGVALAELGPGELFGEATLLHDAMHSTNAVARTAVRALRIDSASLHAVLRENVEVSVHMMRRLAQRLRASDERRGEGMASKAPDPARVAAPVQEAPRAAAPAAAVPAPAAPAAPAVPAAAVAQDKAKAPAPVAAEAKPVPEPPKPVAPSVPEVPKPAAAPAVPVAPVAPKAPPSFVLRHAQGSIVLPEGKVDCLVGRPDPATGAIPEINLGPLDLARSLSRRHARLIVEAGGVVLREEPGVANGTWVNGDKVPPGQGVALKPGDKLRFGAIELEFGVA